MNRNVNYRSLLLKAVGLFLEQTPSAQARALRDVRRCLRMEIPFSLDSIVWGGAISALTDEVYNTNIPYLLALRDKLTGGSSTRARTYINYDILEEFTSSERLWYEKAHELLIFLQGFSFTDTDTMNTEEKIQTYRHMATELRVIGDHESTVSPWGTETIYHLVLREVTEIVTHIDLELSLQQFGYFIPQTPYSTISEESNHPNIGETLTWARKALDAIAGKAWLLVTWQITPDQVHLSFH